MPRMMKVRQRFDNEQIEDLTAALNEQLNQEKITTLIKPGMSIAVAVGSRGVDRIVEITAATIAFLKELGAEPFIVPSMGSHGGATAEGQTDVLRHLGVTEESTGAPIRSTMEVVKLGELENGLPVYVDKYASQADGLVVINRIKPHTAFRGPVESGMMKMISIGLGKQKGAEACHQMGFKYMAENVPAMANIIMNERPFLFGVATVENAFDRAAIVDVMTKQDIIDHEKDLQVKAKEMLPKLFFDQLDVLVIDEIGKNISGDGMDPNITGRFPTPYATGGPDVNKMVVLDLTHETEGNANGVGTADFTTQRLVDQMDREATYANGLTSTVCAPTKIATTLANDQEAIKAAIKTCNILDFTKVKMVRIKNTLEIAEIEVSEALREYVENHPQLEAVTEPVEWTFNENGNLA